MWSPSFECVVRADGVRGYRVGHELIDEFLEFAAGRCRPNTVRAYAHDLKAFFAVIGKEHSTLGASPQPLDNVKARAIRHPQIEHDHVRIQD